MGFGGWVLGWAAFGVVVRWRRAGPAVERGEQCAGAGGVAGPSTA